MDYLKKSKKELIEEIENLKKTKNLASEKTYEYLFNNNPNLLYIQTREGKFIDVNKNVIDKYSYKKEEIIGKFSDFLAGPNNDLDKISEYIEKAWNGKKQIFEFIVKTKKGEIFTTRVTSQKSYYFGKEVIISSGVDITKQKVIDKHIKENERRYRTLFTKNLAGVFIIEGDVIIECNNSFAKIFGYKSRVELVGKKALDIYFNKEDLNFLKEKKQLTNYIVRHKKKNGEEMWISTNVSFYPLENNKYRIEGTLVEITKEVEAEKQLLKSRENYKNLIDKSPYATIIHINGKIVFSNKKAFQFLGFNSFKDLKGKLNIFDYLPKEYQEEALIRREKIMSGVEVSFIELKIKKPSTNEIIDIETKSTTIDYKGENAIHLVFQDISDRKKLEKEKLKVSIAKASNKTLKNQIIYREKIEQKLKESLSEKEVLLKEVHHRVKNNLQVISSILNLQSSYVKDENTLNILRESQNRIKSMAFIHESLYKTDDFSKINFSKYISSLSKNLMHTYAIYSNLVELDLSLEEVFLKLDLSTPCGLIINELVSNALKYAFIDHKKGKIKIELFEKKGVINLIIQDNGLGLPDNINYKETESLGLQLVITLAEQIDAEVILDNTKGAKYTILFKKDQ